MIDQSLRLTLSDEARASLEAVRVAEEAAHLRARRETRRARLWAVAWIGVVAFGALALRQRFGPAAGGRAQAAALVRPSVAPPAEPAFQPPPAAVAEPAPVVAAPAERQADRKAESDGCDAALVRSAPWRVSPEACARTFEAEPASAVLALAIAQAEYARGRHGEAAHWAERAIKIDADAAEAYVILARERAESGRGNEARAAYRRYLALAPRGWHGAEARSALRHAAD